MSRIEHVRTPAGAERWHLPIGTEIHALDGESTGDAVTRLKSAMKEAMPTGSRLPDENTNPEVAPILSNMGRILARRADEAAAAKTTIKPKVHRGRTLANDKPKLTVSAEGSKSAMDDAALTKRSKALQKRAQEKAQAWFNRGYGDDTDLGYTMSFWDAYQTPAQYGIINRILRTGKGEQGQTPATLKHYADRMFKEAGTKTTQPIALYRALRSQRAGDPSQIDWKSQLTPGSTFEDDGMVSTTAMPDMAQGWLTLAGKSNNDMAGTTKPDDVVLEIHVPAGRTVVGGTTQFIETMLPPGSKFKIISSQTRQAKPGDPLDDGQALPPFPYTHVIAELQ